MWWVLDHLAADWMVKTKNGRQSWRSVTTFKWIKKRTQTNTKTISVKSNNRIDRFFIDMKILAVRSRDLARWRNKDCSFPEGAERDRNPQSKTMFFSSDAGLHLPCGVQKAHILPSSPQLAIRYQFFFPFLGCHVSSQKNSAFAPRSGECV